MIKITRPVKVIMILTENSRDQLTSEFNDTLYQVKMELEQLHFQGKKLLADAQKKGSEALKIVKERLHHEEQLRREKMEQIQLKLEQLKSLPLESEILQGTVESEVAVKIGDNWDSIMKETEIVIRDGVVAEIRTSNAKERREPANE